MMYFSKLFQIVLFTFFYIFIIINYSSAQINNFDESKRGSIYFGFGYDLQFYKNSTIQIQQDALRNNYSLLNAQGLDHGNNVGFSPSSLSYRLGYYFSYNQVSGVELSYDPFRYFLTDNQKITIKGTKDGININKSTQFSKAKGNYYYLYGGAGVLQLNYTARYGIYRKESHKFALDLLGKAGLGGIMTTPKTSLDSFSTVQTAQFAGINMGAELGLRWITQRYFYAELDYKYNMAYLSSINIYQGVASQNITSTEFAFTIGVFLPVTHNNPLFSKGFPHRKKINHPLNMYLFDKEY